MKTRPVSGIGSEAFIVDMFGTGRQLTAFRGPHDALQVSASAIGGGATATDAALEKIAKLVFDRWR